MLTNKFVALEQENQRLVGDLQQVSVEKVQQYDESSRRKAYSSVPTQRQTHSPAPLDSPTPMEIDMTRRRGPLSDEEKQRRRANRMCLYCGGPGHIAIHCPHRPRCQVNHISYDSKNGLVL